MGTPPAGVSKAGLWIGALAIAVGLVGGTISSVVYVLGPAHQVDRFQRVPLSGSQPLQLAPGLYVVYFENKPLNPIPMIKLRLRAGTGGAVVPIRYYGPSERSDSSYDVNQHLGEGIATFTIPSPGGTYDFDSASTGAGQLAVGRSLAPLFVGSFLGFAGIGGIGLILGVVLIVVTAVRRRKARRTHGATYPVAYGYPGGYGYPPGYGAPPGSGPPGYGHPAPAPAPTPEYVWPGPFPQGPNPGHVHVPEPASGVDALPAPGPRPPGEEEPPLQQP